LILLPPLYERCTGLVRLLWVFTRARLVDTGRIEDDAGTTSFITGTDGLPGTKLNRVYRMTRRGESLEGDVMKNYVVALGIALTIALPQAAHAQTVTPPSVPDNLEVPAPDQPFLLGHAVGTQNYVCAPSSSLGRVAWTLFTPEATLLGEQHEQLTTHFFSPNPAEGSIVRATWEDSRDTSMVWARAIASSLDPSFVNQNAVAWVLLQRVGSAVGPTGGDTLARTTFVQRVNTVGGVAPPTGCDALPDVGHKAFVPYTADYVFYRH
jgi:hypothetical protein